MTRGEEGIIYNLEKHKAAGEDQVGWGGILQL